MKKIEEKYLESEHQVRAYDVYLSSYRVKGANRVLAYSRLYDGDKFIRDNFLVNEQQADKIEAMFDLVNRILETCKDIDLFTIRVSNKTFANLVKNADFAVYKDFPTNTCSPETASHITNSSTFPLSTTAIFS